MKFSLLPLALFVAAAQANLVFGGLALFAFTIEIREAAKVVATLDVSVEAALTGDAAAETALIEGTITNAHTDVNRVGVGEAPVFLESDANLSGFGRVATSGPGFAQGAFNYSPPHPLGVGPDRRSTANPHISFNFGARTNAFLDGRTTRITFSNPSINNLRITNPGGKRTKIRLRGQIITRILRLT
ncbi:hypothetical protein CORC01_01743 [Colletotrichum orchidophilum]|uniref:Uncharacterized protein n=1 Tax=Colletotrichum orchidophilum TaxID=1209926 RepID=A0A1G4BNU4_9PEZI|nr:uncharacterized protein CORC01_01743 [Colletotrichum orchidophilum]OHF02985.1 hypothetical protein CORC01_01743 [Colletotrichum orchidophilum]